MLKEVPIPFPYISKKRRCPDIREEDQNQPRRAVPKPIKQALKEHNHAVKRGVSEAKCGFFYARTVSSPETKYAVLATGPIDQTQFAKDLEQEQFRPCMPISNSPGGGVQSVQTPRGTVLNKHIDLGVIRVFTKKDEVDTFKVPVIPEIKSDEAIVTPPRTGFKSQRLELTGEYISSSKRKQGQNQVMHRRGVSVKKASATQVAHRAGVATESEKFEWLHLICHRMRQQQNKENLVVGTYHANTLMIPIETYLPHLKKYFGRDISINVSAELLPNSHIAKTINYVIHIHETQELPAKEINFKFDAQLKESPSRKIKKVVDLYMKNVFEMEQYAVELALAKLSTITEKPAKPAPSSETNFDDVARILDFSDTSDESFGSDILLAGSDELERFPINLEFQIPLDLRF